MGNKAPSLKQSLLNPNWVQMREKLRNTGIFKSSRPTENPCTTAKLGKRKGPSGVFDDDPQFNSLTPVSNDFRLTDVVAMDCEMVGVSHEGKKSALGRVTLVNKWGNVIYDDFVRPMDRVVDFRTHISGIRPRDLRKAKDFRVVQKKVAEIIKGRTLVGHALRHDLKALLFSHPKKDLRDTSLYQPFGKEGPTLSLRRLASEHLGVDIQKGEHCPIEDARAAMRLYQKNRSEWEKSNRYLWKRKQKGEVAMAEPKPPSYDLQITS